VSNLDQIRKAAGCHPACEKLSGAKQQFESIEGSEGKRVFPTDPRYGVFTYLRFVTAHQRESKLLIANCLIWHSHVVPDLHRGPLCASSLFALLFR